MGKHANEPRDRVIARAIAVVMTLEWGNVPALFTVIAGENELRIFPASFAYTRRRKRARRNCPSSTGRGCIRASEPFFTLYVTPRIRRQLLSIRAVKYRKSVCKFPRSKMRFSRNSGLFPTRRKSSLMKSIRVLRGQLCLRGRKIGKMCREMRHRDYYSIAQKRK